MRPSSVAQESYGQLAVLQDLDDNSWDLAEPREWPSEEEQGMKFYNGSAPSPRRVRIFLAEKGVEIPRVEPDVTGGDTHSDAFLRKNSLGEVPILELDDGTVIAESKAICRYLEALHPQPNLFGRDPVEGAQIDMWDRRLEIQMLNPLGLIAGHSFDFFKDKVTQVPEFAAAQRSDLKAKFVWLNEELSDGRPFIAGERFTVADISGMTIGFILGFMPVELPEGLIHYVRWMESLRARPSWDA